MHWEVEQKFAVSDVSAVIGQLESLGARFAAPIQQVDQYFNHPARDFGKTDEALRLRQSGGENFITYKGPKVDPTTKTRRELEIPLPDGSDIPGEFAKLFEALGFRHVAIVRKTRRKAEVAWEGCQVELALDEVDSLGTFLELEIIADEASLEAAKSTLKNLAQQLKIGNSERRSYLELLIEKMP